MSDATYQPKVYRKQGGDELHVADDGIIMIESGGYLKLGDSDDNHVLSAADAPLQMTGTCAATTGNVRAGELTLTMTAAATANSIEAFAVIVESEVRTGNWCNAILGKIDYGDAGFVTGLAGVICAELDMPGAAIGAGSYACFEAELIVPTSADGFGTTVPVAFFVGNASGAGVAEWRASGYVFNFTGLGSAGSSNILQANTDQPTHAIRILIDGTPYYLLMTTEDNGSE
jgi:hypothetical protein